MDFEEKMDAMRMNLELAFHDIEALRESIRELRDASKHQYESIRALGEDVQVLATASQNLIVTVQNHDQRITGLEHRT